MDVRRLPWVPRNSVYDDHPAAEHDAGADHDRHDDHDHDVQNNKKGAERLRNALKTVSKLFENRSHQNISSGF